MTVAVGIVQGILIFLIPLIILKFRSARPIRLFGMIGTTYFIGILISLVIFIINKLGVSFSLVSDVGEIGSYVAIAVAIPLLLFNANLKETRKLSKTVGKSMAALLLSLILVVTVVFFSMKQTLADADALSGMAIGLYTGGTPNLNAIGSAMGVSKDTIALANLSDMLVGGVFYIFLLTLSKPFVDLFLKKYAKKDYLVKQSDMTNYEALETVPLKNVKGVFFCVLLAILMAVTSALAGVVLWYALGAVQGDMFTYLVPSLMIGVTLFGIIGSFSKTIREVKGNNLVGQYLILVFSLALSSSLDLTELGSHFAKILLFFGIVTVATFFVHIVFSKLFKVETDCTLIVLTAGIYGPAFVPAVAKQLKNDEMIAPGLIVGSVGYAVGTFLGIALGLFFRLFV